MSEETLQIPVNRGEAKSKGEKERYIHLNLEFQRISRRDKKALLSDQCKETEEGYFWERLGKTRDLFKKIRDTKGTFHNKGKKWYGPKRSRKYLEEVARTHRRTIQKRS